MYNFIPITLTETTLGRRHRQLNHLVDEAFKSGVPFENVENVLEKSPVDRLFKIELASKLKNVDYILRNIKDEDLLYVSRALKSKWLLDSDYRNIINPVYLENNLFPHMVTPSVGKFKNWLYINLKDPQRCQEFYQYYAAKDYIYSIKFLSECSIIFIVNEVEKILDKLSPRQLKILCQKCPKVAVIYFENILTSDKLKDIFLAEEYKYFKSLKVVLKRDPTIFFDISEKYFDRTFNKSLTKYILKHHKHIFDRKLELYTSRLLNINTVAQCLSPDECKEILIQLARAKYLSNWFSYKNVEPLVKRLHVDERAEFKQRIFVKKDVGELIEEWPYDLPNLPTKEYSSFNVFDDNEHDPYEYELFGNVVKKKKIMKRSIKKKTLCETIYSVHGHVKTYLDKLYDEYRFMSFGRTLFELRKRLKIESSPQNREYILLVLVSKSGGKTENLESLLELLSQHSNEPIHVRAAIVRSLVKRAAVWRLPQENWDTLLKFGQGLGLDGNESECDCHEGVHALILRNLLKSGTCEPKLRDIFIQQFSWFNKYPINVNEKKILKVHVPLLIQNAVETETNTEKQAELLELLLNTLETYKVPIDTSPLIPATRALAKCDFRATHHILNRLFSAKIARRTLFYENFSLIQTDSSYLNALRHDTTVLDVNTFLDLIEEQTFTPQKFLRKIAIYFSENGGLMETYLERMKTRVPTLTQPNATLAKSLCFLLGADIAYICRLDVKEKHIARFAADFRANMHLGRTKLDIKELDLKILGAKAVANKVIICPDKEVDDCMKMLLKWKHTVKLGVVLSQRIGKEAEAFEIAVSVRPTASLKTAIKYFRHTNDSFDVRVWNAVRPVLQNIDISTNNRRYLSNFIRNVNYIPSSIRVEYCTILYKCFINDFYYKALSILCHIENEFPNVCEEFIENIVTDFLNEMNSNKYETVYRECMLLHVRILVKYLLVAKSEYVQTQRISVFAKKLLSNLEFLRNKDSGLFEIIFHEILLTLKNNKIFFDNSIVSPLAVMETFVSWMHKYFPIELHFCKYVCIHLTMLYCKAIRQCLVHMPNVFSDEKLKLTEGIDIVGATFGKYIVYEVKNLMTNYFNSITELYRDPFLKYFERYFQSDTTTSRFIMAVIKGILDNSTGAEAKIGIYLLKDNWFNLGNDLVNQLVDQMKKIEDLEMKITFFAELFS